MEKLSSKKIKLPAYYVGNWDNENEGWIGELVLSNPNKTNKKVIKWTDFLRRKEYNKQYFQTHKIDIYKKLLYTYSYNSINHIIAKYDVNINELCKKYNYETYFQNNFRRVCYYYRVRKNSYQYQECYDACLTAYLYSLYHCTISTKRDKDGYIMAYIRKLMRIYAIAAITVCNEADNICKINGFRRVDSDSYQV